MVGYRWAGDLPSLVSSRGIQMGHDRDRSELQLGCGQPHERRPCLRCYRHMAENANRKTWLLEAASHAGLPTLARSNPRLQHFIQLAQCLVNHASAHRIKQALAHAGDLPANLNFTGVFHQGLALALIRQLDIPDPLEKPDLSLPFHGQGAAGGARPGRCPQCTR